MSIPPATIAELSDQFPDDELFSLGPRLRELDRRVTKHEGLIDRLQGDISDIKSETHAIKTVVEERRDGTRWLKAVATALIGLGLTQVGSTIWWASKTDANVTRMTQQMLDVETRIRTVEHSEATFHGTAAPTPIRK